MGAAGPRPSSPRRQGELLAVGWCRAGTGTGRAWGVRVPVLSDDVLSLCEPHADLTHSGQLCRGPWSQCQTQRRSGSRRTEGDPEVQPWTAALNTALQGAGCLPKGHQRGHLSSSRG